MSIAHEGGHRRRRIVLIWIRSITAVVYLGGLLAVLRFGWDEMRPGDGWWFASSAVVLGAFLGHTLWMVVRRAVEAPPSHLKVRREREQWNRLTLCLTVVPMMSSVLTLNALNLAHHWVQGERELVYAPLILFLAVMPLAMLAAIHGGGRKGEPGTAARREWERYNDELGVQHAGRAYRFGLYVALGALVIVLAAALFAPGAVIFVLLVGAWAATVVTSVRFGLLQRAAEPPLEEV